MTIYEIGILTHYYCRAIDHDDMQRNPPVWAPTIDDLKAHGLIQMHANRTGSERLYSLTDRGRVYVESIQRVPLPDQIWVTHWPPSALPEDGR